MKSLGAIESFTGGLFASTIIKKAGASKFFRGAVIAYSNEIKTKLNIDISHGVMSKEVALQMAKQGKEFLNVDICVAFTGNAGPSALENLKVGQVFIAINDQCYELFLSGTRNEIRQQAVEFAINKLDAIYK